MLYILTQAPAPVDPRNCALDNPAAWLNLKAYLIGWTSDNLDRDTKNLGGPFDQVATVTLVSPGIAHGRTHILRLVQRWLHPISILDVGSVDC